MRKWKRKKIEDEDISDIEMARRRRRYWQQKKEEEEEEEYEDDVYFHPRRRSFSELVETLSINDDENIIDEDEWGYLEEKIRSGQYKPKQKDHYTLHVLYNNLKQRKLI